MNNERMVISVSPSVFKSRERIYNNIITAKEMLENNITEIPMLLGHLLPKHGIAMLAGESDTGKSTLIRHLSLAIVTGQDTFLGYSLNIDNKCYLCLYRR